MSVRERISFAGRVNPGLRAVLIIGALVPVMVFWTLTPLLLVREGGRGRRNLILAGCVGVLIDGMILPIASRIVIPLLLDGWTGFGPVGVAMTLMTWCGVIGVGWVVTACAGAIVWERTAPMHTVVESQRDMTDAD